MNLDSFVLCQYKKLNSDPTAQLAENSVALLNYFDQNAPVLRNQYSELCLMWYMGHLENLSQLIDLLANNYSRYEPYLILYAKLVNEYNDEDLLDVSKLERMWGHENNKIGESLVEKFDIRKDGDRFLTKKQVMVVFAKMMLNFKQVINDAYGN